MYSKLSNKISLTLASRGLIAEDEINWCAYILVRWLSTLTLCLLFLIAVLILGRFFRLICFCIPLLLLRRRIGGWHTKHIWSCQLLSLSVPLFFVYIVGPRISLLDYWIVALGCLSINVTALILKPIYPPQTHFDKAVACANSKKKNQLVLLIVAFQVVSIPLIGLDVMIYSSLGSLSAVLSLVAEKIAQKIKGGHDNEKKGNCPKENR